MFANYSSINHCNEIETDEIAIADGFVPIYNEPCQFNNSTHSLFLNDSSISEEQMDVITSIVSTY